MQEQLVKPAPPAFTGVDTARAGYRFKQHGGTALRNGWRGNHWDAFEGFDRDGDGVGDTPFEVWSWTDRLWMDVPDAQLFRATPSLAIVDFAGRLSLSREPRLLLADPCLLYTSRCV